MKRLESSPCHCPPPCLLPPQTPPVLQPRMAQAGGGFLGTYLLLPGHRHHQQGLITLLAPGGRWASEFSMGICVLRGEEGWPGQTSPWGPYLLPHPTLPSQPQVRPYTSPRQLCPALAKPALCSRAPSTHCSLPGKPPREYVLGHGASWGSLGPGLCTFSPLGTSLLVGIHTQPP